MAHGVQMPARMTRSPSSPDDAWVIVLAGGEGKRLAPLTRALYGVDLPKQFAALRGERSLLQATLDRAALIAPAERTVVVVGEAHEALARAQVATHPGVTLLVQPANRDTGPGLLLPLAWIRARAPGARVIVMPADHDVPRPAPLVDALVRASTDAATGSRLGLIGVVPDHPEPEYGWILPGARLSARSATAHAVKRFVEKPAADAAARLRARGALWNTFIMTGPVAALWRLGRRHLPGQAAALERWARAGERGSRDRLHATYAGLAPGNWSSDVLAVAVRRELAVVAMAGSGWSDWGSPRRVFQSLTGTAEHDRLLARIARSGHARALDLAA
jgi:mannose-1-phosphate guanylyltransferase